MLLQILIFASAPRRLPLTARTQQRTQGKGLMELHRLYNGPFTCMSVILGTATLKFGTRAHYFGNGTPDFCRVNAKL
jgi:hypothetical protein